MLATELALFIIPLFISGIIHHFIVIRFNWFGWLAHPLDNGIYWHGKPLLGQAKTWRGVIVMTLGTGIGFLLCNSISGWFEPASAVIIGSLIGLAYSLGELPNSFIKRRLGLVASQSTTGWMYVVDQLDSVLASTVAIAVMYSTRVELLFSLVVIGGVLHLFADLALHRWSYKAKNQ